MVSDRFTPAVEPNNNKKKLSARRMFYLHSLIFNGLQSDFLSWQMSIPKAYIDRYSLKKATFLSRSCTILVIISSQKL